MRPLLAVAFTETIAGFLIWPFLGIWALKHLEASQTQLSITFLFGAFAAVAAGWLGGHLSDHVGRRPLMRVAMTSLVVTPLLLIAVGHHVIAGLVAVTLFGVGGAMFNAASYAMVADLLPPDRREAGYASVRVANNLAGCVGPPLGGVLLIGDSWTRLALGSGALGAVAPAFGLRLFARHWLYPAATAPERGSFAIVRRDSPFLLFVGSSVLASMTYVAFDSLLPISLATSHGIEPAFWGFLVIINTGFVAFGQLRLTRAVAHLSPSL